MTFKQGSCQTLALRDPRPCPCPCAGVCVGGGRGRTTVRPNSPRHSPRRLIAVPRCGVSLLAARRQPVGSPRLKGSPLGGSREGAARWGRRPRPAGASWAHLGRAPALRELPAGKGSQHWVDTRWPGPGPRAAPLGPPGVPGAGPSGAGGRPWCGGTVRARGHGCSGAARQRQTGGGGGAGACAVGGLPRRAPGAGWRRLGSSRALLTLPL